MSSWLPEKSGTTKGSMDLEREYTRLVAYHHPGCALQPRNSPRYLLRAQIVNRPPPLCDDVTLSSGPWNLMPLFGPGGLVASWPLSTCLPLPCDILGWRDTEPLTGMGFLCFHDCIFRKPSTPKSTKSFYLHRYGAVLTESFCAVCVHRFTAPYS